MVDLEPLSVEDAFGDLKDPRSRSPEHKLSELLVVAIAAILSGADSWVGISTWAEAKIGWLRQYLTLANGVASHDTFGRVFAMLEAERFEACFVRWVGGQCPGLEGKVVAIDGKTVRRSHRLGQGAIHLVSAYCGALRVSLGQVKTEAKSNEITAIPELLEALLLKGAVVTIDAMGCQHAIAQKIVQGGADYVLAVKDNQPSLCEALRDLFAAHDGRGLKTVRFGEHTEIGKDHGRIETRRCVVCEDIQWLDQRERWSGLRSVAIESNRPVRSGRTAAPSGATTSAAWGRMPSVWAKRFGRTGRSRTACTGCSMCPLGRISAVRGSRMQRRTLPSYGAS